MDNARLPDRRNHMKDIEESKGGMDEMVSPLTESEASYSPLQLHFLRRLNRLLRLRQEQSTELNVHDVALAQAAGRSGRPREHEVARLQRHHARGEGDQRRHAVDKRSRVRGLHLAAVEAGAQLQGRRVEAGGDVRSDRRERIAAFGPPPLQVVTLPVASGDIVATGVAEDVRQGLLRAPAPAETADDPHPPPPL